MRFLYLAASKPYHLCHIDKVMRSFVKNQERCRRSCILTFFSEKIKNKTNIPHKCCDICTRACKCGSCPEDFFKCNSPGISVRESHYGLTRQVTTEEKETFVEVMHDLNEEFICSLAEVHLVMQSMMLSLKKLVMI